MIRIDLVDNTSSIKHVDFRVVPVTRPKDFICTPDGILPLPVAMRLSRQIKAGRVSGEIGKYVWYRLLGKPAGKQENALMDHE